MNFSDAFTATTGYSPFPWQTALFSELVDDPFARTAIDLPTGLGKTSILAIWLLALAHRVQNGTHARFPRRLIYVVNRRTVVDQATGEAEKLRKALDKPALQAVRDVRDALIKLAVPRRDEKGRAIEMPLAISTLRGEFADNAEWSSDPSRAAVIIGTVDMIGSRLLFSGYRVGRNHRPLHAGFLGQDALLVHDEAHLEPAFQQLLETIVGEQQRSSDPRRLHVIELTATSRNRTHSDIPLLTRADLDNPVVDARFNAKKSITFHSAGEKGIATKIVDCAVALQNSGQAILIYLRELKAVESVARELRNKKLSVQTLTGTMRGRERDALVTTNRIFARFITGSQATPEPGTVYLICTSAGEVGIDMSADHLVCDLTPFDSMAQRFGRVNRFGKGDAQIDVIYETGESSGAKSKKNDRQDKYQQACALTLALLQELPPAENGGYNASPHALSKLDRAARAAAFTPTPTILPATDILFDAWSLTTVRDLPGAPPVDDWLHGVADWDLPETHVAWREEVETIIDRSHFDPPGPNLPELYDPEELLEDYPLKPHELLRDRSDRIFEQLQLIAKRDGNLPVWLVGKRQTTRKKLRAVSVMTLAELLDEGKEALSFKTVILPPRAGGLGLGAGLFEGKNEYVEEERGQYDIADDWPNAGKRQRRRTRIPEDSRDEALKQELARMRPVRPPIDLRPDTDDDGEGATRAARFWYWYVKPRSADDEGSRIAKFEQALGCHLKSAGDFAAELVARLILSEPEASAVRLAARWHDLGKDRPVWQWSIGNRKYNQAIPESILAKSGNKAMRVRDLNKYRHEFGSLLDVHEQPEFKTLDDDTRDLVMHLIAAHHGRARPHFPANESIDPKHPDRDTDAARKVPQRFARLQRKYGRWGLAYLESIVRAADIMASQEKPSAMESGEEPRDEQ